MKKIDLRSYEVDARDGMGRQIIDEKGDVIKQPYDVKNTLIEIIFSNQLKLNGRQNHERNRLADKIEKGDGEVLLEDADYAIIKSSVDLIQGFGKNERELLKRIYGAEEVEVKEKGKK